MLRHMLLSGYRVRVYCAKVPLMSGFCTTCVWPCGQVWVCMLQGTPRASNQRAGRTSPTHCKRPRPMRSSWTMSDFQPGRATRRVGPPVQSPEAPTATCGQAVQQWQPLHQRKTSWKISPPPQNTRTHPCLLGVILPWAARHRNDVCVCVCV